MVSSNMESDPNNDNSTNIEAFLHGHRVNLKELEQDGDIDILKKQRKRRRTSKAWGMMLEKFLKYWSDFCTILTITVIFYPRYKLQFVEWAYKKVYGENSNELKKILERSCFHCLMNICSFRPNLPIHLPCKVLFLTQMRMMTKKGRGKLDSCLESLGHFIRYPELASMARDVLTIPISTVASESAFSVGGRVLDQFRSSLKPETVESIVCSRDWIFGQEIFFLVLINITKKLIQYSVAPNIIQHYNNIMIMQYSIMQYSVPNAR
ncbi:hypothetical protein KPL70_007468 [Citrus sinensis]|nr:hypothetical protein KPL70_007468 [Citrus sinensis]